MADAKPPQSGRVVPQDEWSRALSRFAGAHKGARVSVVIEETDGTRRPVEPESQFELDLMDVKAEEGAGGPVLRVLVHKHPGARLETVELDEPAQVEESAGSLRLESSGGRRVLVEVIRPAPSPA